MFAGAWRFIKRHRRKLIVTGAVVGGIAFLGHYARRKLKEFQDREAADYFTHVRKEHHFEGNQRTCNTTVLSMIPPLRDAIRKALYTEELTALLKTKPDNKIDIWEELKVKGFTRMFVSVYAACILVAVLRVKLNIVGGYIYVDHMLNRNGLSPQAPVATEEIQRRYLEQVHYVMDKGLDDLIGAVLKATEGVVRSLDLRTKLSILDVDNIVRHVRQQLELWPENGYCESGSSTLCRFMMPHSATRQFQKGAEAVRTSELILDRLDHETRDIIENADFTSVLTACLDKSFSSLLDIIAEHFNSIPRRPTDPSRHSTDDALEPTIPMAKLIPVVDGMIHVVLSDMPNPFIKDQLLLEQGRDFAANIYEAFSHLERVTAK